MDRNRLDFAANIATIAIALGVIATLAGFGPLKRTATRMTSEPVRVDDWERFIEGGQVKGPSNAPVTVLEFGDYECQFCARAAERLDSIMDANPGRIRLVYRHWPLQGHRWAYPAARAAECAGKQGRFWEIHRLLYQKQDSLGLISFGSFAQRAGVPDSAAFAQCASDTADVPAISLGPEHARVIGASGTPAVIVNGMRSPSGLSIADIAKALGK